jgi:hypothetical protein
MILWMDIVIGLIGVISLIAGYYLLRNIRNPLIRLTILLGGMILNFVYMWSVDSFWIVAGSMLLGIPMAVLVPLYIFPSGHNLKTGFIRVLICYIPIWIFVAILPLILIGLLSARSEYMPATYSNGLIYTCLMLGVIIIATLIYWILNRLEPKEKKESN